MAKYEVFLKGDFHKIITAVDLAVMGKSISASLEDSSYYESGDVKLAVRVYERYSYLGNNRVSLNITLLQNGQDIKFTAISSGGSSAVFFKMNTIGEENFLSTILDTVQQFML